VLVLTRKVDESLVINDDIVITVLSIEGEKVKIGIKAPRDVTVLRLELAEAIEEQNQIAEQLATQPESANFDELRRFLANEISGNGKSQEETVVSSD
jgi:carbon storage regulator